MNYNQKENIKHLERNGHKEPLKRKVGCLISKGWLLKEEEETKILYSSALP